MKVYYGDNICPEVLSLFNEVVEFEKLNQDTAIEDSIIALDLSYWLPTHYSRDPNNEAASFAADLLFLALNNPAKEFWLLPYNYGGEDTLAVFVVDNKEELLYKISSLRDKIFIPDYADFFVKNMQVSHHIFTESQLQIEKLCTDHDINHTPDLKAGIELIWYKTNMDGNDYIDHTIVAFGKDLKKAFEKVVSTFWDQYLFDRCQQDQEQIRRILINKRFK